MTKNTNVAKQKHRKYRASVKMQTTCRKPTHDSQNNMAYTCVYRQVKKFQVGITRPTFLTDSSGISNLVLVLFR